MHPAADTWFSCLGSARDALLSPQPVGKKGENSLSSGQADLEPTEAGAGEKVHPVTPKSWTEKPIETISPGSHMALGWLLSFLASYPWAATLKAIVCATDHTARAGLQTAASSGGGGGEGNIAALQPSQPSLLLKAP